MPLSQGEFMHWSVDAGVCIVFGAIALIGRHRFARSAYEAVGCLVRHGSVQMYEWLYLLLGLVFTLLGTLGLLGVVRFGG